MADASTLIQPPPIKSVRNETPKGAWGIAFLLLLYMLVNFADKIVVGLAGVPIMDEMKLTTKEFGALGSAFFALFSVAGIVGGFLANKIPTRWLLLGLATVWALVQFPMITTVSYSTLVICRILLGIGEGPAAAIAAHALYKWFPDDRRALPTALLAQGSAFGVIIAIPSLNWLIVHYSWHAAFGALGVVGLLWVVAWLILGREGPISTTLDAQGRPEAAVPYSKLFFSSTFLGCVFASFGAYWALSLGLTWFTPFIVKGLGFDQTTAGFISILPWVFGAAIVMLTGLISQMMSTRGVRSRMARGVLGAAPLILGGLIVLCLPFVDTPAARIALLVIGTGLSGSIYVVCGPMIGEICPVQQRGAIIATYGAIYTIAGVIAPIVTGVVLEWFPTPLEGYLFGYKIVGAVLIASGILGVLLLRPDADRIRLKGGAATGAMPAGVPAE